VARVVTAVASIILIACGALLYRFGSEPVFAFEWEPLSRPFRVEPGFEVVAPFQVGHSEEYEVMIDFELPRDRRPIAWGTFNDQVAAVDLTWSVSENGTIVAAGDSPRYPPNWYGGERHGRDIGIFRAQSGHHYVFTATVKNGAVALNDLAPRVRIALNTNRMTDYGYTLELQPYVRNIGIALGLIGLLLAGVTVALSMRSQRAA
jgi:hypothetical protein